MARQPQAVVLDSWSVMAYLGGEPAAEQVEKIILDCQARGLLLLMSVVNIAEIWYAFSRRANEAVADQGVAEIAQLGVRFEDVDLKMALAAAKFKAKHKMSLADCFAAALAQANGAKLVTGDEEFKQVAREVDIQWL